MSDIEIIVLNNGPLRVTGRRHYHQGPGREHLWAGGSKGDLALPLRPFR